MQFAGNEMPVDTNEGMSLGRIVMLLVAKLYSDDVPLPFRNQEPWHQLFFELKVDRDIPGKPSFLSYLVFDWDGPYPICRELSEFLNGLHITGNVSGHNPRFDYITMSKRDADQWLQDYESLDQNSKNFVQRVVSSAQKEFLAT